MSTQSKDMRMVDDLEQSDELRSLLRAGIDDDLGGYDFDRGLANHLAAVAALPTAEAAPATQSAAAAVGASGKAWIAWIGLPVASASVIAALWLGGSTETSVAPTQSLPNVAKTVPIAAHGAPTTQAMPIVVAEKTTAASDAVVRPAVSVTPTTATRARATRAQRNASTVVTSAKAGIESNVAVDTSTELSAASQTSALEASAATEREVEVGPTAAEREAEARVAAAQAEQERLAREEARRVAEERLKREMAQLMRAKQSLTSNPAQALSLAQAGEQEFRNSLFSEERQHVLILALIKLGRVEEAERRATPYLSAHPDSPFARRVRNALEAAK